MNTTIINSLDRVRELARIRQKAWYDRNVKKVSDIKWKDRELFRELNASAGITTKTNRPQPEPQAEPQQPEYDQEQNYDQEQEPYYEPQQNYELINEPKPVEKARFATLTDKQIKKIRIVPTKSKQTLAGMLVLLKKNICRRFLPYI